jgi:GT2 family glycosyltransferase
VTLDISTVIPTCNRNQSLLKAIASVQQQEGVTLELIVVDDSPEGTARSLIEGVADPRITYLRSPRPTGGIPSIVRNLAWPRAHGTLVHFLDDDDLVPPGHYRRVKALFERRPEVGLVFGRIAPFGDCPPAQLRHERAFFADAARRAGNCCRFGTRRAFAGQMLFDNPLLVCSAGVVRRAAVAQIGGFDPDIRLMEDADFYTRVMRECGAAFMDEVVLHYHVGFPSLMHAPHPPPEQMAAQRAGRRRSQEKYRQRYGTAEFYSLAAFTRLVMRCL